MKRLKITLLLLLISSISFAQKDFKEYEKDKFSVKYPDNWRLDTSGQMNTQFILFSELKEGDLFSENVNLLVQDLSNQGFTMKSFVQLSENQIKNMVPNGKIIDSNFQKDKNCYMMIWSGDISGHNLKFKQYFFMQDEKAYVLTLTATPKTYNEYIETGNKILNSFKLK